VPLFAPLTAWLGARGLFVGLALLWLLAIAALDRLRRGREDRSLAFVAIGGSFLLGPIGFWLVDDLPYGWNVEVAFFPLAVLFAAALVRGSRAALLWGALLLLTREDGAILAWSVHALVVSSREGGRVRLLRVTLLWLALFVAGALWLRHATPPGQPTRVGAA